MSGIDALPKRFDPKALDRSRKQLLRPLTQFEIGRRDSSTTSATWAYGTAGPSSVPSVRTFVGLAAERDLIKLLAVLLDAENADMADMVMAAGIDAAGNVDVQPAEIALQIEIAEARASFPARSGSSAHWRGCNNRAPDRR